MCFVAASLCWKLYSSVRAKGFYSEISTFRPSEQFAQQEGECGAADLASCRNTVLAPTAIPFGYIEYPHKYMRIYDIYPYLCVCVYKKCKCIYVYMRIYIYRHLWGSSPCEGMSVSCASGGRKCQLSEAGPEALPAACFRLRLRFTLFMLPKSIVLQFLCLYVCMHVCVYIYTYSFILAIYVYCIHTCKHMYIYIRSTYMCTFPDMDC